MRRFLALVLAIVMAPLAACASAPAPSAASMLVESPWVRTTTGAKDKSMTAAFLTIVNPGTADVRLTSAECADAGMVQIHEMVTVEGKMVMQEAKDGAVVPAGSHLHLVPGGYHIMLMNLTKEFAVGDQIALTLHFDGGLPAVTARNDFCRGPLPQPTPTPSSR